MKHDRAAQWRKRHGTGHVDDEFLQLLRGKLISEDGEVIENHTLDESDGV